MNRVIRSVVVLLVTSTAGLAQQAPATAPASKQSTQPSSPKAEKAPDAKQPAQSSNHKADRAAAYYHYTLAHMYEEQVAVYGRSDLANKAIDEYRQAIDADSTSAPVARMALAIISSGDFIFERQAP